MARHPKNDKDDDRDYEPDDQPIVVEAPALVTAPEPLPAPPPPAPTTTETRPPPGDELLKGVSKGDLVRLLVAHYDGFQRFEAGSIVHWWNDEPPTVRNAALVETPETPLTAPAMTDGKPPSDYVDPVTGKKPVIGSA